MNKLFVMVITVLTLGACTKDDVQVTTNTPENGSIIFDLAAVNNIAKINTKRPLYSQEALQNVDTVTIYIFKYDGLNYTFTRAYGVDGWTKGSTQKTFAIANNALVNGNYQFLAVGREKAGSMTLTNPIIGITQFQNFTATVTANAEEIFAGNNSATITTGGGVRLQLQMTRQIAGILGYLKNIPTRVNGQKVNGVRLEITNYNTTVNLTNGAGSGTNARLVIYDVNLTARDTNANGTFTGNTAIPGVAQVPNSQLNGRYLIPATSVTMSLVLYGTSAAPLKTWTVKDNTLTTFNIAANHFYTLGRKYKDNSTDAGTPGDITDDDLPVNLLSDQDINITISNAWSGNYNLNLQ